MFSMMSRFAGRSGSGRAALEFHALERRHGFVGVGSAVLRGDDFVDCLQGVIRCNRTEVGTSTEGSAACMSRVSCALSGELCEAE